MGYVVCSLAPVCTDLKQELEVQQKHLYMKCDGYISSFWLVQSIVYIFPNTNNYIPTLQHYFSIKLSLVKETRVRTSVYQYSTMDTTGVSLVYYNLCFNWPSFLADFVHSLKKSCTHVAISILQTTCIVCLRHHCYSPLRQAKLQLSFAVSQTQSTVPYFTHKLQTCLFVFPLLLLCSQRRIYKVSILPPLIENIYRDTFWPAQQLAKSLYSDRKRIKTVDILQLQCQLMDRLSGDDGVHHFLALLIKWPSSDRQPLTATEGTWTSRDCGLLSAFSSLEMFLSC